MRFPANSLWLSTIVLAAHILAVSIFAGAWSLNCLLAAYLSAVATWGIVRVAYANSIAAVLLGTVLSIILQQLARHLWPPGPGGSLMLSLRFFAVHLLVAGAVNLCLDRLGFTPPPRDPFRSAH